MPYNPETEQFFQAPSTIVDSTPDGDTVQEGFDDRLTPAMAGVYTDLNLLKENGMIGVGIPATTTSRGIGRVATAADSLPGATISNGPAFLDAATVKITPTPTPNAVPKADAGGTLNGWVKNLTSLTQAGTTAIAHYASPSGRTVPFAVPANEGTVTAPGDGTFMFSAAITASPAQIGLIGKAGQRAFGNAVSAYIAIHAHVSKGDVVSVIYSNVTNGTILFRYSEGAY